MKNKKNKKAFSVAIVVLCVTGIFVWSAIAKLSLAQTSSVDVVLKGKANKSSYLLGEPVTVTFELTNTGPNPETVFSGGVDVGSLKIFVASERDGEYKVYRGRGWGRLRGEKITLEPRQTFKYGSATILWHGKLNVSHLNADSAKQYLDGRITTEYAFPEPGVYFIKGLSCFGESCIDIESEPIKVMVKEPIGDDLEVWNKIRGNREIAILLQDQTFDTSDDLKKQELNSRIEQILILHPNSVYSGYLKPNLQKYNADELRRKQIWERKIKQDD
ncbi:MAG: hypothetical protein LC730_04865 [Acidobacteria bacterium]|nr:hypothetical protein [Acidobacteriota bacterium]MCA1608776.1 hypothetical protein [Acidobacteriota bacterium]